jgi:hypothetical protein
MTAMTCKRGEAGRGACPPPVSTMIPAGMAAREMVG